MDYETEPVVETEPATEPEPAPTIEPGAGFAEEGNLVTRDLLYDKNTNKQFISVQTSGGNTFYIVIDYDKPTDEDGDQYETSALWTRLICWLLWSPLALNCPPAPVRRNAWWVRSTPIARSAPSIWASVRA